MGYYYEKSWYDNFLFALALSVSVVPEGLPAAISVTLSLGMKKLLKHNVLAKKLNAVETLASVNIICTDKTGTITRNEIMVTNIVTGDGSEFIVDGQGYVPKGNFWQLGKIINQKEFPVLEKMGVPSGRNARCHQNALPCHRLQLDPAEPARNLGKHAQIPPGVRLPQPPPDR